MMNLPPDPAEAPPRGEDQPAGAKPGADEAPLSARLEALFATGRAHHQRGDLGAARQVYESVLKEAPENDAVLLMLGAVLVQQGRPEAALRCFDTVLTHRPGHVPALNNRGGVLSSLGRHAEALACLDAVLEHEPGHARAWVNRGAALRALGRLPEALASHERALAVQENLPEAWNYRGLVLRGLGRLEEALASHERAIELRPGYAEAHHNRSIVLRDLRRVEEALAAARQATALRPGYAAALWNQGFLLLLLGDDERGWPLYEWRWRCAEHGPAPRHGHIPRWNGEEDPAGRVVLLHAEQGLGDTLQFCRFAPRVAALGAEVVLEVQPPLARLLKVLEGPRLRVVARDDDAPAPVADLQCPLMSLPLALRAWPQAQAAPLPYLRLPAGTGRAMDMPLPDPAGRRLKIGLAWAGNAAQQNDANRSMPLAALEPLTDVAADFYVLQKDLRPGDAELLARWPFHDLSPHLADFAETAARVLELDLVITVDTSLAHLAGALDRPAWVMLTHAADFRWLLERDDSPWYPGVMRLYRQPARGDWAAVVRAIKTALEQHLAR